MSEKESSRSQISSSLGKRPVPRLGVDCSGPSLCQRQWKDSVLIGKIIERFLKTGQLPVVDASRRPFFHTPFPGSISSYHDLQSRLAQLKSLSVDERRKVLEAVFPQGQPSPAQQPPPKAAPAAVPPAPVAGGSPAAGPPT